ncbi:unnamed protein product [Brassica rapa]|uniref:K Homology domain-containing protein n=1 Tax=Brassica campestris TaxID=3711 RepID=A0A3P6A157_BRACM|nr:unnamed protein product [Brassica rapa]VDC83489.1 unnamed protein product [Brassica rapa]
MAAVADSAENGATNFPENETLTPSGVTASSLLNEASVAFPESNQPDTLTAETAPNTNDSAAERWPGWPGDCVFRVIVPVSKVGAIIGRKGDIIRKMCEETRARIKVLDGPTTTPDRIVMISAKEEPEAYMSPAMEAVVRVFRRVSGLPDSDDDEDLQNAGVAFSSVRLLVASSQAINLIGKQGSSIKSIVENSGASVRILSDEDTPFYAAQDERIVDLQGEALKIVKALEGVVGHLRKFLVDHSVVPLFEKQYLARVSQVRQEEPLANNKSALHAALSNAIESDLLARREALFLERDTRVESFVQPSGASIYSQDPALAARHSPGLARVSAAFVTQVVSQTMQIPFSYAEDIIGLEGANIAFIRRRSGATITIQESPHPDQITVEIKGTSSQVQTAQQLIQDFISNHKEPASVSGGYARVDTGYVPAYPPQLSNLQEPLASSYMGTETVQYRPTAYSQLAGPSASAYTPSLNGQTYGTEYRPASDAGGYNTYNL